MKRVALSVLVLAGGILLAGCSTLLSGESTKANISSSLIDFLYPDEQSRQAHQAEIPLLRLPVTVGIAFIPPKYESANALSNGKQIALLDKVKQAFSQYDYIDRIELIPSTYLKGGKGFTTLEQVARLHDVDVMALISYDQVQQTYENNAALLYWTIVGMYVIPGNENSVQTFVDTAVFDVKSRKLLFRAPGISKLDVMSTAIGIDETRSEQSQEGFDLAMADMITNLNEELGRFKTRVKEEKIARVEHKEGYRGGGALGIFSLLGLTIVGLRRSRSVGRQVRRVDSRS